MKKILSLLVLLCAVALIQSCKSDDEPAPNNPPTNGELAISSVSPKVIYADDEITIIGKGFSTTKTDNVVELGFYVLNEWRRVDNGAPYEVVSATATQLVVRSVDPYVLNLKLETFNTYGIQITVGQNKINAPFDEVRKGIFFNMSQSTWIEHAPGCFIYATAGDSLYVSAGGLYGTCTLAIDNKPVATKKMNQDRELHFRIPKLFFGQLDNNCAEAELPVKLTNGDGKSLTKMYHIVKSPPMIVDEASFDKASYPFGGGNAFLTIKGYSIYSTAMIRLSSGNGYSGEGNVGVQNYPDKAEVIIGLSGLPKGNYNAQIRKDDDSDWSFPIASFKIE